MLNLKKYYILILLVFCNITFAHSEEKIAFISIDFLIQNSNIGKSALKSNSSIIGFVIKIL